MKSFSVRRLISLLSAGALTATLLAATAPAAVVAAGPPAPYFNGFENVGDATPWVVGSTETQATFDVSRASGNSASGTWHANAAQNPYTTGTLNQFTRLGGYSSMFPVGGYTTSVDIYLDMSVATGSNDLRFDWSSAINQPSGDHRRDFIFSVGTDPTTAGQFVMSASNNSPGWPANPDRDPFTVSASGWYTFQHTFRDNGASILAVDMKVLFAGTMLHSWTLSDPSDVIGTTVGGNRYGWLVYSDFTTLALDNITRSNTAVPACTATGLIRDGINLTAAQIGGTVTGLLDASGCNIGAYFDANHPGSVTGANIAGSNYYGVVVNAAAVNVTDSTIHDIGESPLNGSQHGVGVLYTTINQAGASTGASATGTLSGTTITKYQKNGVVVSGSGAKVTLHDNTVIGEGGVNYIAQNGIQISFGASAKLFNNDVSLNNYLPSKVTACGLLIYKAGGVSGATKTGIAYIKADNSFHNNETDICNFGKGGGFSL